MNNKNANNSSMFCACCGEKLEGQQCGYCGYIDVAGFTEEDAKDILEKELIPHKRKSVCALSDFSVVVYAYKFDMKNNCLTNPQKDEIAVASSGNECFNEIKWSREDDWIAHPQEDVSEGEVEITYRYQNQPKKLNFPIKLAAMEGIWHIGLKIENNLHLSVFVGVDEKNLAGEVHDLALELH